MDVESEMKTEELLGDELCRLCANTDKQMIPIFQGEGIEHNIPEQIETYLPIITVTQTDELPLNICYQCTSTLIAWHNFFEQCRSADNRLREILSVNIKFNEDDETYHDYTDDFHNDLDDQALVTDDAQVDCVLIEPKVSHVPISACSNESILPISDEQILPVSDRQISPVNDRQISPVSDKPIPTVSDAQISTLDAPIMETSDNDSVSKDESKSVIETVNDSRWVAHAGRKRVPLTTKRRLPPSATVDRAHKVARRKNRRLDGAAAPTAEAKTAPKEVAEKTLILVPMAATTSGARAKMAAANVDGRAKVRSTPSTPRYRAIAPKVEPKKILLPWVGISPVVALNCAAPQLKAAPPQVGETSSVAPLWDSRRTTVLRVSTDAQPAPSADEQLYTCFHCQYACQRKHDIRSHIMEAHLDADELTCKLCGRSYSYKSALRRHMLRKHFADDAGALDERDRGYCCDVCGRGHQKQREMLAHRRVYHASAPPICWSAFQASLSRLKQCANCGRLYRMGRFFERHSCADEDASLAERAQRLSRAPPRYRCDLCSLSFAWKLIFRQHREVAHATATPLDWDQVQAVEVRHHCGACFAAFDDAAQLAQHGCAPAEPETRLKLYRCGLCGLSYRRKSYYRQHRRLRHAIAEEDEAPRRKPDIRCPYCDETAAKRSHIVAHIKEAHHIEVATPFVCTVCNKVFKQKVTYETHNQTYHPRDENAAENERVLREAQILVNGEPAYRCGRCNRNWLNGVRYLAHHRLHLVERKFTCDLCGKQTRTQHQLGQHIRTIHLDIRNYACDVCSKSFHTKQSCDQHRRIHTGERPYACEICGKTFVSMNALISHKRVHTDFFPHACHLCPKKFKVRRSLADHVRRHTGERPYQCQICSKTFNNSSLFSYHQKVTHSENRPHKCELCGSRFKANRFLQRHMKLHATRTHIQFKRRNNPEYFAAQEAAAAAHAKGVEAAPLDPKEVAVSTIDLAQSRVDVQIVESETG